MAIENVTEIVPEVSKITPFQKLVLSIGEIPTNYLDSMSYAEQVTWFCMFLQEKVLPVVNQHSEKILEIINYLNNLDLQDEVNNKLDEMTESGQLQEIITSYIDSNVTWTFNNINDMKNATNLIVGSYAKTLGYYTENDGGQAYYLIVDNSSLIDNGGSVIDVNNDLKAILLFENDEINVKQYGAKGNGINDDSSVFTTCFNIANETLKNIYIPSGKYKIENDLPELISGISLIGDNKTLRTNKETVIQDYRTTKTYLIKFIDDNSKDIGGGIKDITFISYSNTNGIGCLSIAASNGWVGIIENVRIYNYKGTAIKSNANDYRFENCSIHHCSIKENDTIYYAISLEDRCNENKFNGCHIEHCRYVLKTSGFNFLNGFYHCKVEMSTINMNLGEYAPPISINSTNPNTAFTFNACDLINLDIEAYIKQNASVNYNSVPALIYSNQGLINIVGNNFVCGQGSGNNSFAQSTQSKYIDIINGIIDSNIFYAPSYITPSISSHLCTVNNNLFYPLKGGTYVGIKPSIACIVNNDYNGATLGNNNRFFINSSTENFITPYRYFDKYTYRSGETQPTYSYNLPIKPNIVSGVDNYITLVIKPVQAYAQLFAGITIHLATFERNRYMGNFTIKVIDTSDVHLISLLDDSQLYKADGMSDIYCCIKNRCVYIQVPVANDGTVLLTADGFEGQYYSAYIDRNINELITDYDYQAQITV